MRSQTGNRVLWQIQIAGVGFDSGLSRIHFYTFGIAHGRNIARDPRRIEQRIHVNIVRVGKRSFITHHGANPNPLVNRKTARLDNPLLQIPTLGARVLKIHIGIIGFVRIDFGKHTV